MNNMTARLRTRRAEARMRRALNRAIDNASSTGVRNELTSLAREHHRPLR